MSQLQNHANDKLIEYQKAQRAADAAERLLASLGLDCLDAVADSMSAYHREVYDHGLQKYVVSPRVGIAARIPDDKKVQVREQLSAALDHVDQTRWSKEHYTQSAYSKGYDVELVEQWEIEFDGWSQGSGAVFHSVIIRFYQEAIPGTVVNGCKIGTVKTTYGGTPARITESIGLVCEVQR